VLRLIRTPFVPTVLAALLVGAPAVVSAQLERFGAWAYGPSLAVEEDPARDLVYLGAGGVVRVVDVQSPVAPQHVVDIHTHGLVEDLFYDAATGRLFLACGEGGLEIWDVATPAVPALLSRTEILYFGVETPVGHVEVAGDIAVLECAWGYVHTVDVSDPATPVQVAFNGVMGNPASDINIGTGGQVHATGAQFYVRLDVDAAGDISVTGQRDFDFGSGAVFGTPEVAYVGYGGSMYILDLLLPGFPPWSVTNVGGITEIEVRDETAFLVNQGGMQVWDVAVHNAPSLLSVVDRERLYRDVDVTLPYAYVAALSGGLEVFDVSDPALPAVAGTYSDVYSGTTAAEVRDGLAYLASFDEGLVIVDVSALEQTEVGRYDSPGSASDVALEGGLAILADDHGGLRIVDVSDPSAPSEVGYLDGFRAWRVETHGDVAYVIEAIPNQPYVLHTVDLSTPSSPVDLGTIALPDAAPDLTRSGELLFVAGDAGGVLVYDLAVPTAPAEITTYPVPDVTDLEVVGDVLAVASFQVGGVDGGLYLLDVSDPMMPDLLGHLYDPGFLPLQLHADDGGFVYAATGDDLRLYDVSDPTSPLELQSYALPWDAFDITSVGAGVYVSTGYAGLQVLENTLYVPPPSIFADGFESGDTSSWSGG